MEDMLMWELRQWRRICLPLLFVLLRSVPVLPPDTPTVSKAGANVLDAPMDDNEDELAVLNKVIQVGG